ncbi:hypothetical protein GCM10010174_48800 [Kutzneria viridogrisea]|uniref:Uncharacterized protein n=2 Tax=Kutzneria TaxID=43356 RepID=W5WKT3_9PSEU|nr:RNA polymerase sigma factor [Kutzneria albida]AHH98779.1 hypothetical protein KALB_5417 [Kutzneria albida DSM 43870]MBA8923707.1 RNA polymerase sigma-70 factor (ECF subfamily) [Kutzneria viridogrisea]
MGVDQERFTQLYRALHPRVLAYALNSCSPAAAREAVDEAFLVAWRKRAELPVDAELPWLLVTTRHLIANQRRRSDRQLLLADDLARMTGTGRAVGPEAGVVERITVLTALAELPERDREALMLTVWHQLSAREAARVAGCSTATFAVRLHRARRRFTEALARGEELPDEDGLGTATVTFEGKVAQ